MNGKAKLSRSSDSCVLGKCTETLKTAVPEELKLEADLMAAKKGFKTTAEWLRMLIMVEVKGKDMIKSLLLSQVESINGIGPESDQ